MPFSFLTNHVIDLVIVQLNLVGEIAVVEAFDEKFHEGNRHFLLAAMGMTLVIQLIQAASEGRREIDVLIPLHSGDDFEYL